MKNFAPADNTEGPPAGKEKDDLQNLQVETSQKCKPRLPETESPDLQEMEGNKTEDNNTEKNNPSIMAGSVKTSDSAIFSADNAERLMESFRETVKSNIEYDLFVRRRDVDFGMLDGFVELMVCTLISTTPMRF
ncbi:hypothetical protein LJC60_06315 [Ruminococcaceae bacterium OttesenSCG-928-D13]|nr:hypothetical protein [Ruminococcaceae bacterium OttesenSCG-928-D13]